MHIYRHISELGHIQAPDLQVSTCTTYDYMENHCKIDRLIGKIKSSLIQESIALCFNLIMV